MTAETEDLALEPLRGTRADMDGLRRNGAAVEQGAQDLRAEVTGTCEAVEARLESLRHAVVASVGSLVTGVKGRDAREGARV